MTTMTTLSKLEIVKLNAISNIKDIVIMLLKIIRDSICSTTIQIKFKGKIDVI